MTAIRPLAAGNWKMNGLKASRAGILQLKTACQAKAGTARADVMVCPPATLIMHVAGLLAGSGIILGAQDCHSEQAGAFTGDLSAEMLADAGAQAVILGHSERRAGHGERDRDVRAKASAAHRAGLAAIICVGETAGQRRLQLALPVIKRQLRASLPGSAAPGNTIIAYEPVWAIGSGLTPAGHEIAAAHSFIRGELADLMGAGAAARIRILYGGSVKPGNAREIAAIADVNGALVGGASLKADDFLAIISGFENTPVGLK